MVMTRSFESERTVKLPGIGAKHVPSGISLNPTYSKVVSNTVPLSHARFWSKTIR